MIQGLNDISVYTEGEEVTPSNPFLRPQHSESSLLDIAMQVLSTVTARKAPRKLIISSLSVSLGSYCSRY